MQMMKATHKIAERKTMNVWYAMRYIDDCYAMSIDNIAYVSYLSRANVNTNDSYICVNHL